MASVHPRKNGAGAITSYQVKWRLGGARDGLWQTERFDDEPSATVFKDVVNECGQQWPPGWIKGKGYITAHQAAQEGDEQYRFRAYATKSIGQRAKGGQRYRDASMGELERYVFPTFGNCDVRSTEHFSKDTIAEWLLLMQRTMVYRGAKHVPMSPKTIKNLHGLLSSILKQATQDEPPLRARNPCERSSLPQVRLSAEGAKNDDEDDEPAEDIEFLEPQEVAGIVACLQRPEDKRLVRFLFATGLRWGEVTALARRHAKTSKRGKREISVVRAWKWNKDKSYYLGTPKTERSKRTIRVSPAAWLDLVEQGVGSNPHSAFVFDNGHGERLPYSTFYDRWCDAVHQAQEEGLLPDYKAPTIHDLRHSHAAVLLSDGRDLMYVQRRLGHESITTTIDRYGHLRPEADDDAMDVIDASLGHTPGDGQEQAETGSRRVVYVAQLGHGEGHCEAFWKRDQAELVAEQWGQDRHLPARVEAWAQEWWVRQYGNGVKDVRADVPDRVRIFQAGPALYAPDGTVLYRAAGAEAPGAQWVWEWEERYTLRAAVDRVRHRPGTDALTEAEAWGVDEEAVREAFTVACATALGDCAKHPTLRAGDPDREGV
ncbi:tyrosine-type recombinase/integrase [Streptomyces sp. NPDC102487]|uniref:tyrosine-type recombinase/integrase n=1 Tax=Streptomyces sp. NPDC102487 TaxID=3366182 RepID=UPI0037FCBE4B